MLCYKMLYLLGENEDYIVIAASYIDNCAKERRDQIVTVPVNALAIQCRMSNANRAI